MGQPSIKEIEESLANWEFLGQLPQEIEGFVLIPGTGIEGQILNIASYVNEIDHCRLDITYTSETFDYVPVKTVGMHTFRDERYFARDREHFAKEFLQHLPQIIQSMSRHHKHNMPYDAKKLHFEQWQEWKELPLEIEGFEQFISPDNPLEYINGSYIVLDYTNFSNGSQIYFLYNTFRNELFAEIKKEYMPITTDAFNVMPNVPDEKKLVKLQELLNRKLETTIQSIAK